MQQRGLARIIQPCSSKKQAGKQEGINKRPEVVSIGGVELSAIFATRWAMSSDESKMIGLLFPKRPSYRG